MSEVVCFVNFTDSNMSEKLKPMIRLVVNDVFSNVCLSDISEVVYFVNWTDCNMSKRPKP